ncbi:MAG: hypothetical protein ACLT98_10255 [Eggerthellaceae bacterium]
MLATADDARSVDIPDGIGTALVVRIGSRRCRRASIRSSSEATCEDGNAQRACRIVLADTLEAVGADCTAALQSPVRTPRSVSRGERSFEGSRIFIESLATTAFVFRAHARFSRLGRIASKRRTYEQTDAATDGAFSAPSICAPTMSCLRETGRFKPRPNPSSTASGKVAIDSETWNRSPDSLAKRRCGPHAYRRQTFGPRRFCAWPTRGFYDNDERFFAQCEQKDAAAQASGMSCACGNRRGTRSKSRRRASRSGNDMSPTSKSRSDTNRNGP